MPKFSGNASVYGGKHLGEVEAATLKEAIEKLLEELGPISLCHQCSDECEDGEAVNLTVCDSEGNEVYREEAGERANQGQALAMAVVQRDAQARRATHFEDTLKMIARAGGMWSDAAKACLACAPDVTTPALMYAAEPTVYGFENRPGDGYYALLTNGAERLATEGEVSLGRQSQVDATDLQSEGGLADA